MKNMKKHHKIILSLAACAVIAVGVAGTYAILTDATGTVVNTFTGEEINTHIKENEDFDKQDVKPGVTLTLNKDVKVVNDGPSDAFIRARVTISPDKAVTFTGTDSKWVLADDDWYYYTEVVAAPKEDGTKSSTNSIMTQVNIPKDIEEDFDITVYQEAVGTGQYQAGETVDVEKIQEFFDAVNSKTRTE